MQHPSRAAPDQRSGKGKSINKRKLSSQAEEQHHRPQQATLSEIFSKNSDGRPRSSPPLSTGKRPRLSSSSPSRFPGNDLIPAQKMYNFSDSGHRPNGPFGQTTVSAGPGPNAKSAFSNAASRQSNFTPHTGAKRLVVKNLRTGPRLDQDSYFEKVWAQLEAALVAVFNGAKPETSLEELYKGSENVCRQGRAAALARKLRNKCVEHVAGHLRQNLLARTAGASNIDTLRNVVDAWASWQSKLVSWAVGLVG